MDVKVANCARVVRKKNAALHAGAMPRTRYQLGTIVGHVEGLVTLSFLAGRSCNPIFAQYTKMPDTIARSVGGDFISLATPRRGSPRIADKGFLLVTIGIFSTLKGRSVCPLRLGD